jgi:integrase/recombinase XerD
MSDLHGAVDDYLTLRRSLGHKLERHNRLLHDFVEFLHGRETTTITTTLAVEWATMPAEAQPDWWATRLGVVRVFAKHHQATDPATEVPPADVFPAHSRRAEPFIYTDTQIRALLAAADKIHTPLKAATYGTLIGLLAVTGMRVGEAIRLDRTDFDPDSGVLTIRDTKFGKTRRIPLHPSTTDALVAYSQLRDTTLSTKRCEALFVSTVGRFRPFKRSSVTGSSNNEPPARTPSPPTETPSGSSSPTPPTTPTPTHPILISVSLTPPSSEGFSTTSKPKGTTGLSAA